VDEIDRIGPIQDWLIWLRCRDEWSSAVRMTGMPGRNWTTLGVVGRLCGVVTATRGLGLVLLLAVPFGCAAVRPTRVDPAWTKEVNMDAARRLERAYLQMEDADLDGLMDLYTEDALIQSAGEAPIIGLTSIRGFWSATFARYRVHLVPRVDEENEFTDVVVVRGGARGTLAPKNGAPPIEVDVWFVQVYRKDEGGRLRFWRGANGPNPRNST
jgi:ketosteroid isomerase-like protein